MMVPGKCLDSQLWHACAGGMVQMPSLGSKVYYFPQGHAEHCQGSVEFSSSPRIPAMVLCKVAAIKFLAERETDEVFVKMRLLPLKPTDLGYDGDGPTNSVSRSADHQEKQPASFAKTLTQSDANNGGGFSVPRYCAETIFPRLDYSSDPPVQTILARDVHGEVWKFRHIYRGTPRRHLLTTGWSTFVNQKKLVAGDSVVFLRADNGDLCIGIRRAKRGIGSGLECPIGWNSPTTTTTTTTNPTPATTTPGSCLTQYGGFSSLLREEETKMMMRNGSMLSGVSGRRRVTTESVHEAAALAANGQGFEVVYYPRASTPEFCVKASAVREATRIRWSSGMRFKMAFETEDSSRISWFMGTVSGVQAADPIRWPGSPWRILQVTWDEPDLLQNVKVINPWLVELVSNFSGIHIPPFSPPRKKLRLPQHPELPFNGQLPASVFSTNIWPSSNSLCYPLDSTPAGIQGARHAQFDTPFSDLHLRRLQPSAYLPSIHQVDYKPPPPPLGPTILNPLSGDDFSCSLTMGNTSNKVEKSCNTTANAPKFVLFGQPILTEEQLSLSSGDNASAVLTGNSASDGNTERSTNLSNGSGGGSAFRRNHPSDNSSCDGSLWNREHQENGQCKVFMESEDMGRTLDLSCLNSYDELQKRLANMFGIEKSDLLNHVLYRDQTGSMKHAGDEPFSYFARTVRRLMILTDCGSDNMGRW